MIYKFPLAQCHGSFPHSAENLSRLSHQPACCPAKLAAPLVFSLPHETGFAGTPFFGSCTCFLCSTSALSLFLLPWLEKKKNLFFQSPRLRHQSPYFSTAPSVTNGEHAQERWSAELVSFCPQRGKTEISLVIVVQ